MEINLISEGVGSICIDVSHVSTIQDMLPIFKAILTLMEFHHQNIEDLFYDELREVRDDRAKE